MTYELGDTVPIRWLIEDAGVGVTGAAGRTSISIKRESDGYMYDFDDDTWQASPTLSYTTLEEDVDLLGVYYYDLDTSGLTNEDTLTVHLSCASSPADTEILRIKVVRPDDYAVCGTIANDYESDVTTMAAALVGPDGIMTTADRATFRIVKADDGTVLLDDEQVEEDVGGVFSHSEGTLGLEKHTAYLLFIAIELGSVSYRTAYPFVIL